MSEVVVKESAPLDELMLAMDVVDTLRHRELVLAREIEAEDRDRELLARLREIYSSQGIVVTDEILKQGVTALREERFVYRPPPATLGRSLALAYVTRGRWSKWVGGVAALAAVALLSFQLFVRGPQLREAAEVPAALASTYQTIVTSTSDETALALARDQLAAGEAAVARSEYADARAAVDELQTLGARLATQYELRIVSRPGEPSGVWRVPDENRGARNYYLIVEAIGSNGQTLRLPITSEEDGRTRSVRAWGLRVDEATFERVAADKRDDGIIQSAVVGAKKRGALAVEYSVPATGAAITEW
jgi:hypothetical protein